MVRHILAAGCAVYLLATSGIALAQSDTTSYSDTMRKHSKAAVSAQKSNRAVSGTPRKKTAAKPAGQKRHAGKR